MKKLDDNPIPDFNEALKTGTVTKKTGRHHHAKDNNDKYKNRALRCECQTPVNSEIHSYVKTWIETRKGHEIMYYHQKPVYMKRNNGDFILAEPYYKKHAARQEINQNLPRKYDLLKRSPRTSSEPRKDTWYITPPDWDGSVYKKSDREKIVKADKPIEITAEEQVKELL